MKRVIWADSALIDLARIDDWYADRNPDFAALVGDAAVAAGRFLLDFPNAGSAFEGQYLRKWPVPGTDYRLFYRPIRTGIEIVRIRHAREDWRDV